MSDLEELKKLISDEREKNEKFQKKLRIEKTSREESRCLNRNIKKIKQDMEQWKKYYEKTKNDYVPKSPPLLKQNYFQDWTLDELKDQYDRDHFEEMKKAENIWHYFSKKIMYTYKKDA